MSLKHYMYKACTHITACIDGEKEPPKWLHRSHRLGHVLYLGTGLFAWEVVHHTITYGLVLVELGTFVIGADWSEMEEIDEMNH